MPASDLPFLRMTMDEPGIANAAGRAVNDARPAIIELIQEASARGDHVYAAAIAKSIQKRIPILWSTIQEYSLGDPYQTLKPFVERIIRETQ